MIKSMVPLSMIEAGEIVAKSTENKKLEEYIKKFSKIGEREAVKMKEEILNLKNYKIKEEHIVKIIDFLPEDSSDINKIFIDVVLDENEIKSILDVVSKYR